MTETEKLQLFSKTRRWLMVNYKELSSIILWVAPVIRSEESSIPVGTDGKSLFLFDSFFELKPEERAFRILHIVFHVALRHPSRALRLMKNDRQDFDKVASTVAQDLIINWSLSANSNIEAGMPRHTPTFDSYFSTSELSKKPPAKWSYEKLYVYLKENLKPEHKDVSLDILFDEVEDEDVTMERANDDLWKQRMDRAMSLSGSNSVLRRLGGDLPSSKVPWRNVFRNIVQRALSSKTYSSYSRPHKRTSSGVIPYYLPSTIQERTTKEIGFVVDTSGSMSDGDLTKLLAEIIHVQGITGSGIRVIFADADVLSEFRLTAMEVKPEIIVSRFKECCKGGGGTNFCPAIELLCEDPPDIAVYLTDGYGGYPSEPTPFPFIWAMITDQEAPWGTTICIED